MSLVREAMSSVSYWNTDPALEHLRLCAVSCPGGALRAGVGQPGCTFLVFVPGLKMDAKQLIVLNHLIHSYLKVWFPYFFSRF